MTDIVPLRAFKDNYIWIIRQKNFAAAVDPGDATPVLDYLRQENLKLIAVLNTHHHFDHTGGNHEILKHYAVPVYGPAYENIPGVTHPLKDGDQISLKELDLNFSILHVPPHTAGHIAYYNRDFLFCGDTLFGCSCGGISEGTPEQMVNSLSRLAALPDTTSVYCGHEYTFDNIKFSLTIDPDNSFLHQREIDATQKTKQGLPTLPSTIGLEKKTNPFLRCQSPEIFKAVLQRNPSTGTDPAAIFAALKKLEKAFFANY
jgi:hydroxyacylglutathione hydrolase